MKYLLNSLKSLAALSLVILAVGCATELQDKEDTLVAAGFKAITPTKPDQKTLLTQLPADKVTRITHQGKTYYVLPDVKNNQAFVGGPKQYQAYQQLRLARQLSNQNLEAAEYNAAAATDWGAWGGWGAWGVGAWY